MSRAAKTLLVLAVLALSARAAATMEPGLDYFGDAGGAIDELVRGNLDGFFADQPLMGSFSLLLRAPFVALVFHSSETNVYFVGSIPCLLTTLALGLALGRLAAERGASQVTQGLIMGLAVINPVTFRALNWGHPEELLTAALCVGAVLAALRDRTALAAVLLGLAMASKQWAVIALLPVLLATPHKRVSIAVGAGALAAVFTVPMYFAAPGAFESVTQGAAGRAGGGTWATPWSLWWLLSHVEVIDGWRLYVAPAWVGQVAHPLIVLMSPLLALALWLRKNRRRDDALLLLALLFLLRCLLDQWNNDYYHAPFVLSLLAWEVVRFGGFPHRTVAVALLHGISFFPIDDGMFRPTFDEAARLNALYLLWTLPLAGYLGLKLLAPARLEAAMASLRRALSRRSAEPRAVQAPSA